jgi:demethylmenaquinone methyltransferase/2-methoxy-6-polyprenyl-1,4-benzoquinol methylase
MAEKKIRVRKMFDDISGRYDLLNHLLSMGIDRSWRKRMVRILKEKQPKNILDVASGTGDVAIAMAALEPDRITGIDISSKMLEAGREKILRLGLDKLITMKQADAEKIPFSDHSFDAVTVAFGVRNFEDLDQGLKEMRRVLRPGGLMMILEFSHPSAFPFRQLYRIYSSVVIPFVGRTVSGHNEAYRYLPDSVSRFPSGTGFLKKLELAGMKDPRQIVLTFGVATIYLAVK